MQCGRLFIIFTVNQHQHSAMCVAVVAATQPALNKNVCVCMVSIKALESRRCVVCGSIPRLEDQHFGMSVARAVAGMDGRIRSELAYTHGVCQYIRKKELTNHSLVISLHRTLSKEHTHTYSGCQWGLSLLIRCR